jgi:translation initiation factor 5A
MVPMKTVNEVRNLRVNGYLIIDDEPCKILSISTSKPGKHGEAKARIEAVGLFDGTKRSIVHPVKHRVGVPMIDKRQGQVITASGASAQVMDLETYETFEMVVEEEFQDKLEAGQDISYMVALGRMKITRA